MDACQTRAGATLCHAHMGTLALVVVHDDMDRGTANYVL